MEPIAQHITMRLVEDQVLAPTPKARRLVARVVFRLCARMPLLAFACVDTHLHLLVAIARAAAGRLSRAVGLSLGHLLDLGSPFEPSRYRPVSNIWHLSRAVEYVLTQGRRHGLPWEAFFEASSLPDLLGMRPLGAAVQTTVARYLPRLCWTDVLRWTGWKALTPLDGPPERLVEATLRAAALPSLGGRSQAVYVARKALVALTTHLSPSERASLLGLSERSVHRLSHCSADPRLVTAIRLQLGWMALTYNGARPEVSTAHPSSPSRGSR